MRRFREGEFYEVSIVPGRDMWAVSVVDRDSYAVLTDEAKCFITAHIKARLMIQQFKREGRKHGWKQNKSGYRYLIRR